MNKQTSRKLEAMCAMVISSTGKDIDLTHAHRTAKKKWNKTPGHLRTSEVMEVIAVYAVGKAYEIGLVGGTWSPWQPIRHMYQSRSKYGQSTKKEIQI